MSRPLFPSPVRWQSGVVGAFIHSVLYIVFAAGLVLFCLNGEAGALQVADRPPEGPARVAATEPVAAERGSPAARLLPGEFASEHWELTARFESGHLVFAEFLITNIGLGDRNAAASGYVIEPNGKSRRFRNGRREGEWTLSADRLHITVGASQLDLSRIPYRLRVDKRGIRLDLRFHPRRRAVWAEELAPSGYMLDVLDAAAPIEGTLWVRGMEQPVRLSGVAAFTYSWMNDLGSKLVLRRIEFFSLHDECPLYAVDITAPDGARTRWAVIQPKGADTYESHAVTLALADGATRTTDRQYPVPRALSFHTVGMRGHVELDRPLLRSDPLGDLPRLFRAFVSLLLNLRPLRIWAPSAFTLSVWPEGRTAEQDSVSFQGTGVTAITFLNPMPASGSERLARTSEVCRANWCADQLACGP